jgi:alkanesulfonate monooxygenase SsuD/methylene tetrahydromethanopterin reductase-like flavin-dependent oxidoreductase (luciferase family)
VALSPVPLSILDLAAVGREETIAESFAGSVELARVAERSGYRRIWYAEDPPRRRRGDAAEPLTAGDRRAAELGLPYAFASHFAPRFLHGAIALYREEFKPSRQQPEPYVIAGVGVIAAETAESAAAQFEAARRIRARALFGRGQKLSEEEITALLASPQAAAVDEMLAYTAAGTPDEVSAYLEKFAAETGADELMTVHYSDSVPNRLRSVELLAGALDPAGET